MRRPQRAQDDRMVRVRRRGRASCVDFTHHRRSRGFFGLVERKLSVLIDSLTFALERSGCLDTFWGKLDEGADSALGVANSARPFLTAARLAHRPQTTLVVVAGEDAAITFAQQVAA